ncbi:hypothetical protein [Isoptericola sp. NPDC056578]|uniref:hypothetical protein n=1 Tax=unclassified Isoptericola TaxID=2623355 RepID=UPI00368B9E62
MLRELLDHGTTISHDALDAFDEREVWSLRRTLVDLDIIPERHDPVARLDVIAEKLTADLPPSTRSIVRAYASWWYLRRARRRYEETGRFTYPQFRNAWQRIVAVGALLQWLESRSLTLEGLDQSNLELWLGQATHAQRAATGDFVRWAARRRLVGRLTVTHPGRIEPAILMSEDERWTELRRCLTDATMPDDVRAAGALLLLYGIPLQRIVELTHDNLIMAPGTNTVTDFRVTSGAPAVTVPPRLGRLLTGLPAPASARGTPLIDPKSNAPAWLFPGRGTAGHVTYTGLANRLRAHGLSVRQSRNAALIGLAADLPAPVISDLLGLSVAAAVNWTRRAGRDWSAYMHLLAERQAESATQAGWPGTPLRGQGSE